MEQHGNNVSFWYSLEKESEKWKKKDNKLKTYTHKQLGKIINEIVVPVAVEFMNRTMGACMLLTMRIKSVSKCLYVPRCFFFSWMRSSWNSICGCCAMRLSRLCRIELFDVLGKRLSTGAIVSAKFRRMTHSIFPYVCFSFYLFIIFCCSCVCSGMVRNPSFVCFVLVLLPFSLSLSLSHWSVFVSMHDSGNGKKVMNEESKSVALFNSRIDR